MRTRASHPRPAELRRLTGSPRESDGWRVVSDDKQGRQDRSRRVAEPRAGDRPVLGEPTAAAARPRTRGARSIVRPAVATVLAVLALVLLSTLLAQAGGTTLQGTLYRDSPSFRIWALAAAAIILLWLVIAIGLWRLGRRLQAPERSTPRWTLPALYAGLAAIIYVIVREFLTPDLNPALPVGVTARWLLLLVVGLLACAPAVWGLWLVYLRLKELGDAVAASDSRPSAAVVVPELRTLWKYAQSCLVGLVVITFTYVLQNGLLRKALLSTGYAPQQVPMAWLLLLGGFLTALALLVYSPFFFTWSGTVARLLDAVYPLPADGLPTDQWLKDRDRLRVFLDANNTLKQNMSVLAGVLAPLGGSLLSVIFPQLK
jgi:hypothetical protein